MLLVPSVLPGPDVFLSITSVPWRETFCTALIFKIINDVQKRKVQQRVWRYFALFCEVEGIRKLPHMRWTSRRVSIHRQGYELRVSGRHEQRCFLVLSSVSTEHLKSVFGPITPRIREHCSPSKRRKTPKESTIASSLPNCWNWFWLLSWSSSSLFCGWNSPSHWRPSASALCTLFHLHNLNCREKYFIFSLSQSRGLLQMPSVTLKFLHCRHIKLQAVYHNGVFPAVL